MKTVLLSLVTFCFLACSQTSSKNNKGNNSETKGKKDSARYMHESLAFIDSVIATQWIMDTGFFLIDTPISLIEKECNEELKVDSATISIKDLDTIIQAERKPIVTHWTKEIFPQVKFLHGSIIDSIFRSGLLE